MPHALVTGTSGGIGRAIARELLDSGWGVTAHYGTREPEGLAEASTWQADFTRPLEGQAGPLDEALDRVPSLDAVVHSAGVAPLGAVAETTRDDWERSLAVNLHAPVELTRLLLPRLRRAPGATGAGGHVVYINSGAGLHSSPRWSAYSAAKHAARAWLDALRAEERDVRATSIYPGRVATGMQRQVTAALGEDYTPERYVDPATVARSVRHALEAPADAQITDLRVNPR
ncbi:SDR family oxidoreductase [Corynebacterium otitidis]